MNELWLYAACFVFFISLGGMEIKLGYILGAGSVKRTEKPNLFWANVLTRFVLALVAAIVLVIKLFG